MDDSSFYVHKKKWLLKRHLCFGGYAQSSVPWEFNQIVLDIEKVREEARQKENRYLEIISQYEEQLKKYKEELHIYQRREEANQKTSKAEEARKGIEGQGSTNKTD